VVEFTTTTGGKTETYLKWEARERDLHRLLGAWQQLGRAAAERAGEHELLRRSRIPTRSTTTRPAPRRATSRRSTNSAPTSPSWQSGTFVCRRSVAPRHVARGGGLGSPTFPGHSCRRMSSWLATRNGFVKVGEFEGEATDSKHKGWSVMYSLSAPLTRATGGFEQSERAGGRRPSGRSPWSRISTPPRVKIQKACATGQKLPKVKVELCTTVAARHAAVPHL
jgi:hypothetical protein